MRTHEELIAEATKRLAVRAEIDRLEREEMPALDSILRARKEANMTQEDIAKRMGVSAPVVSRLENALITGKHSPSLATLRKYAAAMGKRVEVNFV